MMLTRMGCKNYCSAYFLEQPIRTEYTPEYGLFCYYIQAAKYIVEDSNRFTRVYGSCYGLIKD